MICATDRISSGPNPREVVAGVPTRIPDAVFGGNGSNGMAFLLTVIPISSSTASGIRIGTPATTSRGFGPDEMRTVGRIIIEAIGRRDEPAALARLAEDVRAIVNRYPVPGLPAA